jgi:hypothetical protein
VLRFPAFHAVHADNKRKENAMKRCAVVVSVLVVVGVAVCFANAQTAAVPKRPTWQYGMLTLNDSLEPNVKTWSFAGGEKLASGTTVTEFYKNLTGRELGKGPYKDYEISIPAALDAVGAIGWELVLVIEKPQYRITTYYFKRAID